MTVEKYDLSDIPPDMEDMVHVALLAFANKVGWALTEANDFNDLLDLTHDVKGFLRNMCEVDAVLKEHLLNKGRRR